MIEYNIIKYPDGTFYAEVLKVTEPESVQDLQFKINTYEDLWKLKHLKDALDNMGITVNLLLPNLLDGQADKRFENNQSAGLKLLLREINEMKFNKVVIFHVHNSEAVEMALDNVTILDNSRFIMNVLLKITLGLSTVDIGEFSLETTKKAIIQPSDIVVLLPDGGAYKWGVKLMDKIKFKGTVLAAAKNRKYDGEKTILTQQLPEFDFTGKTVLLIDDICIGGATFRKLSKMLKEKGADKLYLAVSHITVQDLGKDPVTNYFDSVFTTNSKFDNYYYFKGLPPFDIETEPENLQVINLF